MSIPVVLLVGFIVLSTVLVVASSMLSSQISAEEEERGHAPAAARSMPPLSRPGGARDGTEQYTHTA